MPDPQEILSKFKGRKILVAGDLMLDRFVHGSVDRISPEGPIPVLTINREDVMLGGAGNVISNLYALGCVPIPFCVVGADEQGQTITKMIEQFGLSSDGIVTDKTRPTTIKTRYVAGGQQLLRTDLEKTHSIESSIENDLIQKIKDAIKQVTAVVLSDYGKGVLTKSFLSSVISIAKSHNIPVLIDPKGHDYSIYRGATIVTPNRKELALAACVISVKTDKEIQSAAQKIIHDCGIDCVVATRSEDGLSVISKDTSIVHIPTTAREVYDVSGAGDTVIATLAACLAVGADIAVSAGIANLAGGIAVSKSGTAPVRYEELLNAVTKGGHVGYGHQAQILNSFDEAAEQIQKWQSAGLKVGLTNGCFDIVHAGHVNYINQARGHCDRLVLALNHDASVRILKGPSRPVNDQNARATVVAGLGAVDMVVFFGAEKAGQDNTPCALIEKARPDIYFKGGDYTIDQLPEAKIVQSYGGEVAIMRMHEGFSTTAIIEKSRKAS